MKLRVKKPRVFHFTAGERITIDLSTGEVTFGSTVVAPPAPGSPVLTVTKVDYGAGTVEVTAGAAR